MNYLGFISSQSLPGDHEQKESICYLSLLLMSCSYPNDIIISLFNDMPLTRQCLNSDSHEKLLPFSIFFKWSRILSFYLFPCVFSKSFCCISSKAIGDLLFPFGQRSVR